MEKKKTFYEFMALNGIPAKVLYIMKKYNDKELSTALLSLYLKNAEVYSFKELTKDEYGGFADKFGGLIIKLNYKERFVIDCTKYLVLDVDRVLNDDSEPIKTKKTVFKEVVDNPKKRIISKTSIEKRTYCFYRFLAKATTNKPNVYMPIFIDLLKDKGVGEEEIRDNYIKAVATELNLKILREDEANKERVE